MKKIATLYIGLLMAAVGEAETFSLSYQGFPYYKTSCEGPTYAAGAAVKLTTGIPEKAERTFAGWKYNGVVYAPGTFFTMPAQDVELEPAWLEELALEEVEQRVSKPSKYIRDGQVIILRDGVEYDVLGIRIN